eukprot:TRINITY_DN2941_c0_g1_i2.p1 TRINITY_DN2941_c0_g1~~TRINITY_DN2941_c0_g1_i2.p1  ORF type:complete len:420 (+),score=117.12 TRINITY_DN2941_c0_g1_i2:117-1376(+)
MEFVKKLKVGDEINKTKLREIFKDLSKGKDEFSLSDCIQFYCQFLDQFKLKKKISFTKYEDEEEALLDWDVNYQQVELDLTDYIKQRLNNQKMLNYYQFEKGFLIMMNNEAKYEYLGGYKNTKFNLSSELEIHQITLREDNIFEKNLIKTKKIKPTKDWIETSISFSENFKLPEQKGSRLTIFTMIFKYLSVKDTLKCGLVSKEWLEISRNDALWKIHLHNFQDGYEERYPFEVCPEEDMESFYETPHNEIICRFFKNYKMNGNNPLFLEYFKFVGLFFSLKANLSAPSPPSECGINIIPRSQSDEQTQSESKEICQKPEVSFPFSFISISNNISRITTNEEGEEVGCCHDSVKEIAQPLFSKDSFNFLSKLKMGSDEIEVWKKSICKKVSLECMEVAMTHQEIRNRLFDLISFKFFDL